MSNTTWSTIYDESGYCVKTLAEMSEIDEGSFRKYLNGKRNPRQKNLKKMESIMQRAQKEPRIKYHPAYGYATEQQIEQLKEIGLGPVRDALLKKIEEQTRTKGKFK